MKVAIHQPHYFPWLGYLDKMAKADKFILMDEVQLTDKSNMFRNKFLTHDGKEKFLTVCFTKKGYMDVPFTDVTLNKNINWQVKHINFIRDSYKKTPYFNEIWERIEPIFLKEFDYLCDVDVATVLLLRDMFAIDTDIIYQHDLKYDKSLKKNELVLQLCKCVGADKYLSGNGARKYMDVDYFHHNGVEVEFQSFVYPSYTQLNTEEFVPNLSGLDVLFNCGIDGARKIFWDNVNNNK